MQLNDMRAGDEILIRARVIRNDADTLIAVRGSQDPKAIGNWIRFFIPWDDVQVLVKENDVDPHIRISLPRITSGKQKVA